MINIKEGYHWVPDIPASVSWILASRYLPIHRNCIPLVTRYLFKQEFFYDKVKDYHRNWSIAQLEAYAALFHSNQTTVIRIGRWRGKKTAIAGISANLLLTRKKYSISIVTPSKRQACLIIDKIYEMLNNRIKLIQKNHEIIYTITECVVCAHTKYICGTPDLILVYLTNHVHRDIFENQIYPILEMSAACRLIAFSE